MKFEFPPTKATLRSSEIEDLPGASEDCFEIQTPNLPAAFKNPAATVFEGGRKRLAKISTTELPLHRLPEKLAAVKATLGCLGLTDRADRFESQQQEKLACCHHFLKAAGNNFIHQLLGKLAAV